MSTFNPGEYVRLHGDERLWFIVSHCCGINGGTDCGFRILSNGDGQHYRVHMDLNVSEKVNVPDVLTQCATILDQHLLWHVEANALSADEQAQVVAQLKAAISGDA